MRAKVQILGHCCHVIKLWKDSNLKTHVYSKTRIKPINILSKIFSVIILRFSQSQESVKFNFVWYMGGLNLQYFDPKFGTSSDLLDTMWVEESLAQDVARLGWNMCLSVANSITFDCYY